MIGTEEKILAAVAPCLEESIKAGIHTQKQVTFFLRLYNTHNPRITMYWRCLKADTHVRNIILSLLWLCINFEGSIFISLP